MTLEYSSRPNKFNGVKRIGVAYARFSSDNQRDESIEAQVRAIKYYAQNFGIEIVKVYADRAKTGRTDNRPQFLQMIEDSKKGEFDVVLVHKLDRFSRDAADTNSYEKELKDNGVQLISVLEKLDESPEGQLMKQIIIGMNAFYSANLAREVRKGLKENALQGKYTGGRTPFGYKVINGRYTINEDQAIVVRRIFDMYNSGVGRTAIARSLNEEGYRASKGGKFYARIIGDILNNEKYAGIFNYKIDGEIISNDEAVPPIVSYDTFKKAQDIKNQRYKRKYKGRQTHALTGKLVCGECGANYTGGSSSRNRYGTVYRYYICGNTYMEKCDVKRINKTHMEWFLVDLIAEHILDDNVIEKIAEEAVELANIEAKKPLISSKELDKQTKDIARKLDKLMDLYVEDSIDKTMLNNKSKKLNDELRELEIKKRKATTLENVQPLSKGDFLEFLKSYRIDTEDEELKLALLDTFIDKIIVYNDRIDVNFKVDFSVMGGKTLTKTSTNGSTSSFTEVSENRGRGGVKPLIPIIKRSVIIPMYQYDSICSKHIIQQKQRKQNR